ncbi:hypothetical protein [Clostridium baratii]|uniref:hypothetical protein n=1 Tax=Clostridium baratii TaxID=1561 RepID=UPI0030D0B02D
MIQNTYLYRVTIAYKFKYPHKEEYYTETERIYKDDYISALELFERAKGFDNVSSLKLDKILQMEAWENGT